ncbi:MAG TPA: UbiD family decarboxylase [Chitinispirillaceae bacterium]|jgi:UbiD family decarboxylase|nr:UbiD family decarboxylase [Chitinispirillaceae bacterium]
MELRKFIDILDKHGFLKRVKRSVDWKYEIGEIARNEKGTPLLFENIRDYPGFRLFTGGMASLPFIALALGMEPGISRGGFIRELKRRSKSTLRPEISEFTGDYKSWSGGKVNLFDLPVPWWSREDGGRYIGTWHINVSKDPVTGFSNAGVYRMQIVGRNQTTVSVSPRSHFALHIAEAESRGEDLALAVAIGIPEAVVLAAAAGVPYGNDEFMLAGGFTGEPLKLARCGSVDLEVPADSEIVLEGFVKRGVRVQDGPFLDYAGIPSVNRNAYLFEVKRVCIREGAFFRGMSVGAAGAEDHQIFSVLSSLGMTDFHGSALRQLVQNFLLKSRLFTLFQYSGRAGKLFRDKSSLKHS